LAHPVHLKSNALSNCYSKYTIKQELSYRKQIARQLRKQYAEGIYDNPVTLKCIKGHSTSLETETLNISYTTYYKSSYLTLNIIVPLKCGSEIIQGH